MMNTANNLHSDSLKGFNPKAHQVAFLEPLTVTAPEHTHNQGKPLDLSTIFEPVACGSSTDYAAIDENRLPLTMRVEDFAQITDEWAALFENPQAKRSIESELRDTPYLTQQEADERIAQWKARTREQFDTCRGENSDKTILSFFDLTGEWSRPWREAGYNVITFDIQTGQDVMDFSTDYFIENWDFGEVYGILAACPCTDFAVSGARWFAEKDADGRTEASKELVFQTLRTIEYFRPTFWALENPVGRIEKLTGLPSARLVFQPHHFGADYTKKTVLWGKFNADLPTANTEPTQGSKMHSQYGGKSQATKNARSETPEGFSYAFFLANNYEDKTPAQRLTESYPEASGAILKALEAGIEEETIRELMQDTYENYEYEEARNALIDAVKETGALLPMVDTATGQFCMF